MHEAQFRLEEGATPEQVDQALQNFGMAMGIFAVEDMAGLDVAWRVRRELRQFSAPGQRKPLVADALCEMRRFGQESGKGWYTYGEDGKRSPDPEVVELIRSLSRGAGIPQRQFTENEIIERALYGLINEGARGLEEGFACGLPTLMLFTLAERVWVPCVARWSHVLRGFSQLKAYPRSDFELRTRIRAPVEGESIASNAR